MPIRRSAPSPIGRLRPERRPWRALFPKHGRFPLQPGVREPSARVLRYCCLPFAPAVHRSDRFACIFLLAQKFVSHMLAPVNVARLASGRLEAEAPKLAEMRESAWFTGRPAPDAAAARRKRSLGLTRSERRRGCLGEDGSCPKRAPAVAARPPACAPATPLGRRFASTPSHGRRAPGLQWGGRLIMSTTTDIADRAPPGRTAGG